MAKATSCAGCGASLPPKTYQGNPRKWCSESCRVRTFRNRLEVPPEYFPRSSIAQATCDMCGKYFGRRGKPGGRKVECCSVACRKLYKAEIERDRYSIRAEDILGAQRERRATRTEEEIARTTAVARERKQRRGSPYPSTVAAWHRRRARVVAVTIEDIDRAVVFERDDWRCGICDGDVNPEVSYPHPLSASLDHVVPISLGGDHSYANTRLTHLRCNVRRSNKVETEGSIPSEAATA